LKLKEKLQEKGRGILTYRKPITGREQKNHIEFTGDGIILYDNGSVDWRDNFARGGKCRGRWVICLRAKVQKDSVGSAWGGGGGKKKKCVSFKRAFPCVNEQRKSDLKKKLVLKKVVENKFDQKWERSFVRSLCSQGNLRERKRSG